jgi:hypothetical protein
MSRPREFFDDALPSRSRRASTSEQGALTAIEQQLRRSVRPDPEDVPKYVLHCIERDQTDSVVQEMHRYISEHHQAGK